MAATKLSLIALLLTLKSAASAGAEEGEQQKDQLWCRAGRYGLERMENRKLQNGSFCSEHAGRTCCDTADTDRLRAMYETLRQRSEVSQFCLAEI